MSKFKSIDKKIKQVAEELNARLSIDRPNYAHPLRTFEERRIDWIDGEVNKAIIIQPHFSSTGLDSSKWYLMNVAWIKKKGIAQKPGWRKTLVDKEDFKEIESRIDELLDKSVSNLRSVSITDVQNLSKEGLH